MSAKWKNFDGDVLSLIEPAPLTLLGPYFLTRKLVRKRYPLWKFSPQQIREKYLLGPWTFAIYETILVTLVSALLVWCVDVAYPLQGQDDFERITDAIIEHTVALLPPLIFMLDANIVSWAALRRKDYSSSKKAVSKYAYLYIEGAYGLVPQMFFTLSLCLLIAFLERGYVDEMAIGALTICTVIGYLWLQIEVFLIAGRLFTANGYHKKRRGPWLKYFLSLGFWGGLLLVLLFLAYIISVLVLATAVHWVAFEGLPVF